MEMLLTLKTVSRKCFVFVWAERSILKSIVFLIESIKHLLSIIESKTHWVLKGPGKFVFVFNLIIYRISFRSCLFFPARDKSCIVSIDLIDFDQ